MERQNDLFIFENGEVVDLSKVNDFYEILSNTNIVNNSSLHSSIKWYLDKIGNYNVLSSEEQDILVTELLDNKKYNNARQALILHTLRLVVFVAKHYAGKSELPLEDLIQEGNIGLITSIDKYNRDFNTKFSTYATWWIRQAITRAMSNFGRMIRIPVHAIETMDKIKKIYVRENKELNSSDQKMIKKVCKELDITKNQFYFLLPHLLYPTVSSLDVTIGDEGTLYDIVADTTVKTPDQVSHEKLLTEIVDKHLKRLTPREQEVIEKRFGLHHKKEYTLEEIGQDLHISRERVRQIQNTAIEKLRIFIIGDFNERNISIGDLLGTNYE